MIGWVQRSAAAATGILLAALLFQMEKPWPGMAACLLNLGLVLENRLPQPLRRVLPSPALGINTVLTAYGVLIGGPAAWGVCAVSASLLSWNAGLFLQRRPQAPLPDQYRYLRCASAAAAPGLFAGLSALALQGRLYLPFWPAFLLMLVAAVLLLRLISRLLKASRGG